ncbi:MAG: hypothetical protein SFU83_22150 [Meiothermus sp.]|nr:hypothetical protein [Meiothermus sp.]
MNRPLSILQVVAILLLLFGLWIGLWTVFLTAPQFAALQREGIQKNARVARKLPYRSICAGRTCKPYVLRVSFFTEPTEICCRLELTPPKVNLGKLIFAELEVTEAEYNATQVDDRKKIVYLERNPEQVWLAETALAWRPWTNYAVSVVLLLSAGLLQWSQVRVLSRTKQ